VPSPELFRSHSAASQKTLDENSQKTSKSPGTSRRRHRSAVQVGDAAVDPARSRGGKQHNHHPQQSLSTLRTQSLRIEDNASGASWNDSKTSINYDGAFENEPVHYRCDREADDDGTLREYNASLAATGSAYDVSAPFTVANSPNGSGGVDGPSSSALPGHRNDSSRPKANAASSLLSWLRCGGCRQSDQEDMSFSSYLWIQFGIFRDLCGRIVNDPKVELFIILLIVVNAIVMGVETCTFVTDSPSVTQAFEVADKAFLIVFTIESALQFIYHGIHLFSDGWLLFDFIVVVLSWSLESLQVVRAFRIFRCIRLIARLEVLKNLVISIFAVAPSMSAILMLLVLILYVYAVMCTQLFGDYYALGYTDIDYFSTLFLSLFTLFAMMTLEWGDVVRQVMEHSYWSCILFNSFLVLTSFILYSLIIAVVCDAVKVTEHHDEMKKHVEEKEETRQRVFALEHRVADMAQHQGAIVEQLQLAVKELAQLRRDEDASSRERENDADAESLDHEDDDDDDHELAVHDVWGTCERTGDDRLHSTTTTLSATSACPSSPSTSSRRYNHYSSGNSMALSAVFSQDSSRHNIYREGGPGASHGTEGDLGTTCHAVVAARIPDEEDDDNEGDVYEGDHDDTDTTTHREEGVDDDDDAADTKSLDLAAMHRRYAAS
jgi:Ion transport protein